jgi:hypothetical protein
MRIAWDLGSQGDRVCASDVRDELVCHSRLAHAALEYAAQHGWAWLAPLFGPHAWERAGTAYPPERLGGGREALYRRKGGIYRRGPEPSGGAVAREAANIGTLFPVGRVSPSEPTKADERPPAHAPEPADSESFPAPEDLADLRRILAGGTNGIRTH